MGSSPEDLSDILFEDGLSFAIEILVPTVQPKTPEVPPSYPRREACHIGTLTPMPGKQDSSSVEEFRTLYPRSCAADVVVKPDEADPCTLLGWIRKAHSWNTRQAI